MDALEVMKQAYANNYQGSISQLIEQEQLKENQQLEDQGMEVASTPDQREVGLSQGPPRSMAFPNSGGQSFNTMEMDYPIDIEGYDKSNRLVQSYKAVQPGVANLPMGDQVSTVIENPTQYRDGGYKKEMPLSERLKNYRHNKR